MLEFSEGRRPLLEDAATVGPGDAEERRGDGASENGVDRGDPF